MNLDFQKLLQKDMTRKEFLGLGAVFVASISGITGLIRELESHAGTPTASLEPEAGTVSSAASVVSDTTASGARTIKFGTPTTVIGATGGTGVQATGTDANTGGTITRYQDLAVLGNATGSGPNGRMSATIANCSTPGVSFAPGNFTFYDFLDPTTVDPFGIYFRTNITSVIGAGSAYTNFVLAANSQSISAPTTGTNQQNKIRIGSAKITLKGINFPDTTQKSLYNGVYIFQASSGSLVEDVVIRGCPGNDGVPPGETFLINNYQSAGLTMTNVDLDGRNAAGTAVASSLAGNNRSTGYSTFNNVYFHNSVYGAGSTEYLSEGNFTFNNCKFENIGLGGANFEQFGGTSGTGTITFNNCQWTNCRTDLVLDNTYRSTPCTINEPILAPGQKIKICLHSSYSYGLPSEQPNLQRQADVTLIYQGVTRNDLINFVTDY